MGTLLEGSRNFPYRIRSGPITFSDLCFLVKTLTDAFPAAEPHKSNEAYLSLERERFAVCEAAPQHYIKEKKISVE